MSVRGDSNFLLFSAQFFYLINISNFLEFIDEMEEDGSLRVTIVDKTAQISKFFSGDHKLNIIHFNLRIIHKNVEKLILYLNKLRL